MIEIARACTYRRSDGTAVVGLCMPGVTYPNVIDLARAWDGDFITPDFKCVADQPPMLNAIKLLRALFEAGAFPRNFATLSPEDVNVWMQTGRAAMSLQSMGRNRIYNDPQKSKFPGKIKTIAVPASQTLASKYAAAPAKVEFWGLVIPKNAKRKDLSWSFIKAMVSKEATLKAALNGNGPVRASTYAERGFRQDGALRRRGAEGAQGRPRAAAGLRRGGARRRLFQGRGRSRRARHEDAGGGHGLAGQAGPAAAARLTPTLAPRGDSARTHGENAMPSIMSRRHFGLLAGSAAASLYLPRLRPRAGNDVTALGHRVHQTSATTGPGGDATEAWRKASGATVNWVTFGDVNAIHERLLREATLGETSIDVAYLLNGRAVPRNLKLFEPLDALQKQAPIEAFDDFAPGLLAPLKLDGALHGIPVRHATNALIYNEALLEERGVSKLPTTFEELIEVARKLTFKRDDGTQVYGLAFTAVFASNFLTLARCLGGDYMTSDGKLVADEPAMVKALTVLAELYKAGVLPRNFATVNNEEITTCDAAGPRRDDDQPLRQARHI